MNDGWFYLHTNNDLIYKPNPDACADIRDSDFAVGMWAVNPQDRANAWSILVESLSAGARKNRVFELAEKWKCDDEDAANYASRLGLILGQDGDKKTAHLKTFSNLQESPCGFGDTYLEAMAHLAQQMGYKPSKMWGNSFRDLVAA